MKQEGAPPVAAADHAAGPGVGRFGHGFADDFPGIGGIARNASKHHSRAFPCMSWSPKALGSSFPTGAVQA